MKPGTLLILVLALGTTVLVGAGVYLLWSDMGVTMSMHGWIAYGLGSLASFMLSGGLFWLLFHSARGGHDDVERPEDDQG